MYTPGGDLHCMHSHSKVFSAMLSQDEEDEGCATCIGQLSWLAQRPKKK